MYLARHRGSGFCLHVDLTDQREGALLHRGGSGEDLEGRRVGPSVRRAAGVAHDGGKFGQQGREAVRRFAAPRKKRTFLFTPDTHACCLCLLTIDRSPQVPEDPVQSYAGRMQVTRARGKTLESEPDGPRTAIDWRQLKKITEESVHEP